MRESIRAAIRDEMTRDPSVIVFGEDVARAGGVFKVTAGLLDEFGELRVRDTPIAETAIVGAAIGAAAAGLRPVVEIMFADFLAVAMDQIVTELTKIRYLSRGRFPMRVVIRASAGAGLGFGAQHSQATEAWFMSTPGLVVVAPSGSRAAYGLTRAAIQSDDPVLILEPRALYGLREDFDPATETIPDLGTARIVREGGDVTVVALGSTVRLASGAAERLSPSIQCEVIDLRTILPWDHQTVFASARRTGRLVTVEEGPWTGGWGTDIASSTAATLHGELHAPIVRLTCPDTPVPAGPLERMYLPSVEDTVDAMRKLVEHGVAPPARWRGWKRAADPSPRTDVAGSHRRAELAKPIARYQRLCEIRAFEDAIADLYSQGLVPGPTHTSQGQEAIAVGIAATTRPTDLVTCTYRGHGIALALGGDPTMLIAEILGRSAGCLLGRGGSMHLVAPGVGLLPTFAIVGAGIPVAAGAALAAQVNRTDAISVAVFGDGASNIGAFHESLNLAAVWRLPVVFVCENNLYGEYSPVRLTTSVVDIAERAEGYAMPGRIADGMKLDDVCAAMEEAVERARSGGGPSLLEMKTYRFSGHSRGDPASYRADEEVRAWESRDPLRLEEQRLLEQGLATADLLEARERATETIAAAVAAALASPPAEPGEILTDVWADRAGEAESARARVVVP